MNWLKRFHRDDEAATAVEYAVMLALILLALIGSVAAVGGANGGSWGKNDTELSTAFGS